MKSPQAQRTLDYPLSEVGRLNQYDLFLSHNRKQKPWVREFASFLRKHGLRVFYDEEDIQPGQDIISALEEAVESSRTLVLVLSRSSVCSRWVSFETAMRLYEDVRSSDRRLVPILVEPLEPSLIRPAVRRLDFVDLTDPETREYEFGHFLRTIGVPPEEACCIQAWPEPSGIDSIFVADINTVIAKGWDGRRLLDELIKIDYQIIDGLTAEHEGHTDQWAPVFMDHPDTWRLITNSMKEIVGYWHFTPLFPEDYDRARQGLMLDSEITTDRVRLFEIPGEYDIYFVTIGLLPRYRRTRAILLTLKSLLEVFLALAREGIFIREICANAYTRSGEAVCKSLGMKHLGPHQDHGKIYCAKLSSLFGSELFDDYAELKNMYRKKG